MLFDSHAHYNDAQFDTDRAAVLSSMAEGGVGLIMNVSDSIPSVEKVICLAEEYPFIYAAVGVHPEETENLTEADMEYLEKMSAHEKVKAIGEIGLDYHYDDIARDKQKYWFKRQLELAYNTDLPVIIHDRDAHADCIEILKSYDMKKIGGVMHCYSGSAEMAGELVKMGMYLGFGGVVTFKNAKKTRSALEAVPLDRILIETDCPYLAPEPHRGERNTSLLMHFTAEKIAEIKGVSKEDIEKITRENAERLYRL